MSEKAPLAVESLSKDNESQYDTLDSDTLAAIAEAKNSIDQDSATPNADLRTAVRESLEARGHKDAFKQVYDMNNLELNNFVAGAEQEVSIRHAAELQSIVAAYDEHDTFAERRTALREFFEANGDTAAFKKIYNMNNLEITSFVNEARQELQEATSVADDSEASVDSEDSVVTSVSSQEVTVEPPASEEANDDPTAAKVQPQVPVFGNSVHIATPPMPAFSPSAHIATPASIPAVPTFGPSVHTASPLEAGPSVEPAIEGESQEEYEARQGVSSSENEPAPITPEEPLDQTPEQNVVTEKLDWKYALKHPGRYAAIKMNDYYQEKGVERKVRDKQITQRMLGIITGVVVAYAAYKTFDIASGMLADHHVADTAGSLGNHEATPPTDLDLEKSHVPPAEAAPQGSGAWGPQQETFSDAAYTVDSGEGWNQTIQETTGVTDPAEQARILQKAGPELQAGGYAYFDQLKQEYRISAPGRLPNSVLQLLQNSR